MFSIFVSGQTEKTFTTLDYKTVMTRLFDITNFNAQHEALWKPNYSERINMLVSDDGFCHTALDTSMYFNSGDIKHAVMIFSTSEYQGGMKASCHACAPTLSMATFTREKDGIWQLVQFKKDFIGFGAWGKRLGRFGIEKLGKDFYCLKAQTGIDSNQGYERGVTTFYSLNGYEQYHEVFSFVYYDSNEGAMEEGKGFTEKITMKTTPKDDYYIVELSSKRTGRKLEVKKKYTYSEAVGRYMPFN